MDPKHPVELGSLREPSDRSVARFVGEGGPPAPSPELSGVSEVAQTQPAAGWVSNLGLEGRSVVAADGRLVGSVAGFHFDPRTWKIQSLAVKLNRDFAKAIGERHLLGTGTIEVPTRLVQSLGDAVVLNVAGAELRQDVAEPTAH